MSIIFPSIKPSQRSFKTGAYPTKAYRSLSGATSKRSYGNKSFGYELRLVFENIDDASTLLILKHYNLTSGGFSRFQLPASVFSGMDEDLRRLVAEDLPNAAPSIRWEYAGPPEVESVISGRSTVQVTLIGEQYGSTSSPITIIDPGGGGGPELPLGISFTGDIILVNNVPTIAPGAIVNDDINSFAAIAFSKLATGALPATITVASANITNNTIVNADINSSAAIALSKLATGALPTAITVASANIVNGTIVDADVNASAAIATSKLSFLQSGTSAQARTVSDKFRDSVSVLDFIPEAEHAAIRNRTSTYNCAANFQAALNAHTSVYVPAGRYTIGSTLTVSNKSMHLFGEGERISTLRFTGGTHGLSWSSNVASLIKVENLDFLAEAVMNGSPVRAVYTAGSAPQYGGAFMENVLAHDLSSPNKWTDGYHFTSCQVTINDCVFLGRSSTGLTGSGFKFSGFCVDSVVSACQVNEANTAYDISGTCEGMSITNCTGLFCNIGVLWYTTSPEPLLCIVGCHFNTITDGIRLANSGACFISNCLLFANTESAAAPGYTAVNLFGGVNRDMVIADNIFSGVIYAGYKRGVRLQNAERVTIENNIFKNMDLAIEIQASASNCQAVGNYFEDDVITRMSNSGTNNYHHYMANGELRIEHSNTSGSAVEIDRQTTDGDLIRFYQGGVFEGVISVAGTTVTYGGGHLARWSQLPNDDSPANLLKGTVMSNLEEMCQWGEEQNEQLNKTMVSSVEGDVNVAGVFVAPSPSDDGPLDFFLAMTGDMIIRIGEGVSVARGDLLMSAGDGTAKPQEDGIVQSKTIAKVVSAHVSCIYNDGSYCVPCVLMAC